MLRELLHIVMVGGSVVAAVIALLYMPGDFMTSEEKRQSDAIDAIRDKVLVMSGSEVAEEIGAAYAYAEACSLEEDAVGVNNALALKGISWNNLNEGGEQRADFLRGAQRVAELVARDGGRDKNRDLTCKLGIAAFGENGSVLPRLIR